MKIWLTIVFIGLFGVCGAQTMFVKQAAAKLEKALVVKDTVTLKQLLHKNLSYGHSNGWVQSKEDVVKDLVWGKIVYRKMESRDPQWTTGSDWATLRTTTDLDFLMDGKEGVLKLHVLQVWMKTNKGWQLLARQSTKL
jgi:hypothetical protein